MACHWVAEAQRTVTGSPLRKAALIYIADQANHEGGGARFYVFDAAERLELTPAEVRAVLRELMAVGFVRLVEAGGTGAEALVEVALDLSLLGFVGRAVAATAPAVERVQ